MEQSADHILDPSQWVEKHSDFLYNYAIVRLSNKEMAEDVVQDTFLSAFQNRDNFKGESSERTWLVSILKHKIINVYRKKNKTQGTTTGELDLVDSDFFKTEGPQKGSWNKDRSPHSNSFLPEGEIEIEELRRIIEKCIDLLPENIGNVFIMKMIDEASSEEICKEFGISLSNIWVMMHRARLRLRNCLEINWMEK